MRCAQTLLSRLAVAFNHLQALVPSRRSDVAIGGAHLLGRDDEAERPECPEKRAASRSAMSASAPVLR